MAVKRIATNIATDRIEAAKISYGDGPGMAVAMDLGCIVTFTTDVLATSGQPLAGCPQP